MIPYLNPLEGYLKLSGNVPVAKIALKPKTRKTVATRFVATGDVVNVPSEQPLTKAMDNPVTVAHPPEKTGVSIATPWYSTKEEAKAV